MLSLNLSSAAVSGILLVFLKIRLSKRGEMVENKSQGCSGRSLALFLPSMLSLSESPRIFATWQNPPGTKILELANRVNKTIGSLFDMQQ